MCIPSFETKAECFTATQFGRSKGAENLVTFMFQSAVLGLNWTRIIVLSVVVCAFVSSLNDCLCLGLRYLTHVDPRVEGRGRNVNSSYLRLDKATSDHIDTDWRLAAQPHALRVID